MKLGHINVELVKIIRDDEGAYHRRQPWHIGIEQAATRRTLCTGEAYGLGDSRVEFDVKYVGKSNCDECKNIMKHLNVYY